MRRRARLSLAARVACQCDGVRPVAAPAHYPDGSHASGDVALREGYSERRVVAWVFLRRKYRGRGGGLRDCRVLPVAAIRSEYGGIRRSGNQLDRGCTRHLVVETSPVCGTCRERRTRSFNALD